MASTGNWIDTFPGNQLWSNALLVTKGMAPYNAVAMGEIDLVCERLRPQQTQADAWRDEWARMGAQCEKSGDAAEAAGSRFTAGNFYLRAGMYYFTAERFIYPGAEKRAMGQNAIQLQQAGLTRRYSRLERVEVPFGNTSLPAYFMPAEGVTGPAPTVVVFDGMDNCKEMSILFNGLEFAKRGINTLAIDGPGQGESLRLRELYARHDYEVAGSAAYDYVSKRTDVDAKKVVVMGYSFGGYYAARVAAFEKRYAAGVAFAALHWDLHAWQKEVKRKQDENPTTVAQSTFHFQWIMGCLGDPDAAIEKARKFSLVDVAPQISCPFLILHGEDDRVVPLPSAHKLYAAVGSKQKHLKLFSTEETGAQHAQVDNRVIGVDYIADWIAATLG
jgi:dienelactone hydrolase